MQYILSKRSQDRIRFNCPWHAASLYHLSHLCIKWKGSKNLDYFLIPETISYIMTVQILQPFAMVLTALIFSLGESILS